MPRDGIARLNSDGSLDTSFDPGSVSCTIYSVLIDDEWVQFGIQVEGVKFISEGYFTNIMERGEWV